MTTVISVENLSKTYRLGQIGTGTFTHDLAVWWAKVRGRPNPLLKIGQADHGNRDGEELWALKDVSFEVKQGEVLGIIGRNGAGKSTLLKILSRVTAPTSGKIKVRGRVASLLEVGTGFHPELTGRENVYLNGAILGMTKQEVARKFDEIVDFAGVEKFIDTPVKRYSSGMYVRLAFAVAAHLDPEILVVDEVLAVGDAEFQKKCLGKMGEVAQGGRTVLFVSHNMAAVRSLCRTGVLFSSGKIQDIGSIDQIIASYIGSTIEITAPYDVRPDNPNLPMQIVSVGVKNLSNEFAGKFSYLEPFCVEMNFLVREELRNYYVAIHLHDSELNSLIFLRDFEVDENLLQVRNPGKFCYKLNIPAPLLVPGQYYISVHVVLLGEGKKDEFNYGCPFEIQDTRSAQTKKGLGWYRKINPPLKLEITNQ